MKIRDLLLAKTTVRAQVLRALIQQVFIHSKYFDYELMLMKPLLMKARFCEMYCLVIHYLILSPQEPHEVRNIFEELNKMLQIE